MELDEDAQLMLKVAQSGDQAAFAKLFDRHQASVVRFAYRYVGSQARAEELAQDIFIKLYRSAKGYQVNAQFKTYLFRVATNHCLNEVRRGEYDVKPGEIKAAEAAPEPAGALQPDQALEGQDLEREVSTALSKMSERERAAFCMCRFEGMAYRDIAAALEATEGAVKSLIHRATLVMMKQLEGSAA